MKIKVVYKVCDACKGKGYDEDTEGIYRPSERIVQCPHCKGRGHTDVIDSLEVPDEEVWKFLRVS